MGDTSNRRPLASRDTGWARGITRMLVRTSITPNQISFASMVFAALAGICFWQAGSAEGIVRVVLLIAAALCCQGRLLCNLFDGLVAVEGGKQSPDGPFWNEFPDRIADIFILAGAGYGVSIPELGWAAAAFAVLTAYVRELGVANGQPADFSGPMAKQHRMAVMTAAAVLATLEPIWQVNGWVITAALCIVAAGVLFTALRRSRTLIHFLKTRG